ncbi:MAG: hypothetical protein K2M73_07490 [Lachnospiraceae bacterium]|nr:hypothetical protein [Lachnospiraceae bacterium]
MKNFYNFKIYKESFKQLRVIGIIMTAIMVLIGAVIPISEYIDVINGINMGFYPNDYMSLISSYDICDIYYIIFILAAPILTLFAYNFLTSRNSCDFYHSIPHKRSCIFFSILSAIITWISIIFVSCTVVLLGFFAIFSNHLVFNSTPLLIGAVNCFINSLLVVASISLACTITGTTLNNILVSGIIMFFPRILIYVCINLISSSNPFLINFDTFFLFKIDTNMLIGALANVISYRSIINLADFGAYTIYTLILVIIYFGIAAFLFCKRKSETAGTSSVSSILQTIFRVCIGIVVTLPSISWIYSIYNGSEPFNGVMEFAFVIIINFIIAIVIMFIYEIITTRKIKKALKALIFSPILIAVDALIIALLIFAQYKTLNLVPDTDEVDYICLYNNNNYYSDYFDIKRSTIKIENKEAIDFFVSSLQQNIDKYKENPSNWDDYSYYYKIIPITFNCNGTDYSRYIYFNNSEYNNAMAKINNNININSIYLDLPSLDENYTIIANDSSGLSTELLNKIYTVYREEILSNPEPYLDYMNNSEDKSYQSFISIYFQTYVNDRGCTGVIPVLPDYTDTTKMYLDYFINNSSHISNVNNILNNINNYINKNTEVNIQFNKLIFSANTFYNDNSYIDYSYFYHDTPSEEAVKMFKEISTYLGNDINTDDYNNLYIITITLSDFENYANDSDFCMMVLLPDDFTFVED